jgi:hypothetical protein
LRETQFCLESAYRFYLTYRIEKKFISEEEAQADYKSFHQQLKAIVIQQNSRTKAKPGKDNPPQRQIDYLRLLRSMCRDRRLILADRVGEFKVNTHDGVIHKDFLYLRRDRLMASGLTP